MKNNLVLIGMPGSGKSTVGKILAEKMGFSFVDLDAVIENMANKSISQIFSEDGEPAFRDLEQKSAEEVSTQSRQVIATGGGVISVSYTHLDVYKRQGKMRACIFGNEDAGSFDFSAGLDPLGTLERGDLLFVKRKLLCCKYRKRELLW